METVAQRLARFIQTHVAALPSREPAGYTRDEPSQAANLGDIADMLKLPESQTLYPKQRVRIRRVRAPDGDLWYPEKNADVLLLGDSFSNIYSLDGMGWGEGAGFAEQLSYALQRPLDTITNNAGGSHVTRERLARDLARGKDRLAGKRLVLWQFAMRDLLSGDWKMVDLPATGAENVKEK